MLLQVLNFNAGDFSMGFLWWQNSAKCCILIVRKTKKSHFILQVNEPIISALAGGFFSSP